ncbi:MAG: ribonuclease H-like domain-containing protein [Anaerolineales bacterium]|nr:ribonuclease H-like domain-containing protein [Anaerolineales bacterium]
MSPSISDRFKDLGVSLGAKEINPPKKKTNPYAIEKLVPGTVVETQSGESYIVENRYPLTHLHGSLSLKIGQIPGILAEYFQNDCVSNLGEQEIVFLDTETTGLSGAAGIYAFEIGAGKFSGEDFLLTQFFMRHPGEERAMLETLEAFLGEAKALVTFNGKAFDIPLLNTRYRMNGLSSPVKELIQIDLLHLARRLWRYRLASRTLGNLEEEILGIHRTGEDVPGWMIPQLYIDYLKTGDARSMKNVLYHNEIDILSMVTLLEKCSNLVSEVEVNRHPLELLAKAHLLESLGYLDQATEELEKAIEAGLEDETECDSMKRLSFLHKKGGDTITAISLWMQAAAQKKIFAYVELAKYYEHRERNIGEAMQWVSAAITLIYSGEIAHAEKMEWEDDLLHRMERLERKLSYLKDD